MRFKTKWKKILISTAFMLVEIAIIGGSTAKAALQANSTTHNNPTTKRGAGWISEIRKMENGGQTMGLGETQNADLSPVGTNNIDVHMMRTTEFGAMAILSASGFGNPKKLSEVTPKTTTGNVTGVYITGDRWEWTAGTTNSAVGSVNTRYYDSYTTTRGEARVGDGLGRSTDANPGCALVYGSSSTDSNSGWHGSGYSAWINSTSDGFRRGGKGIFSFLGGRGSTDCWWANGNNGAGRGVAVIGKDL